MVEDKKTAAGKAAELAYKHTEKVVHISDPANVDARKLVAKWTRKLKNSYERDHKRRLKYGFEIAGGRFTLQN